MWLNEIFQSLSPIAFTLGPVSVRWYGIAYILGFFIGGYIIYRVGKHWRLNLSGDDVMTLMVGIAFGVILGARLFFVLFYGDGYFWENPSKILAFNEGGMSFHGGLFGAVVAGYIMSRILKISFPTVADLAAIGAPIGLFFGRCANFINGELWGKPSDVPWAVAFPTGGGVFRHPSQLYEAIFEGLVIFIVLYAMSRKYPARPQGTFIFSFLTMYGVFRFFIEFVRVPDAQLGYLIDNVVTMGQLLSLPLVIIGVIGLVWVHKHPHEQKDFKDESLVEAL